MVGQQIEEDPKTAAVRSIRVRTKESEQYSDDIPMQDEGIVQIWRTPIIHTIPSVKVFEKYEYNYLREIILRRADYQEYKISEKDFKSLHPNDFEDLFLLNIQEKLNHLPKTDKTSLHTAVNMWIRNLDILKMEMEMEIRSTSDIK
ncbi:hypothetical protein Tco_0319336 [Tanacetum coccineum]